MRNKTLLHYIVGLLLALTLMPLTQTWAAGPPAVTEIGGQTVLTLISRDPPGVRCNNNMQVAAELTNIYKLPVIVVPQALAGPGAKAPAVYYGNELIAIDGGEWNGMVSYTQLADLLEMDDVPKHPQTGRLMKKQVKPQFDMLKSIIKEMK